MVRVFSGTLDPDAVGARLRPLLVVLRRGLRPRGPRRGRADRRPGASVRRPAGAGRPGGRGRPRHHRPAQPGRDRRHPLRGRPAAGAQAVVDARAAAAGRDRGRDQVRRGQALLRARPAGRRGPEPAHRAEPGDPPAGALGDGRVPRRGGARPAQRALRRQRRAARRDRAAPGDASPARPRDTAATSSSPAATASTRSATSRSSRCRRAAASSSSTRSSAAPSPASSSPASRRACAPRWSAASATATRWSTCG